MDLIGKGKMSMDDLLRPKEGGRVVNPNVVASERPVPTDYEAMQKMVLAPKSEGDRHGQEAEQAGQPSR